jgi:hypothetical protein
MRPVAKAPGRLSDREARPGAILFSARGCDLTGERWEVERKIRMILFYPKIHSGIL